MVNEPLFPQESERGPSRKALSIFALVEGVALAICIVALAVLLGYHFTNDTDTTCSTPTSSPSQTPSASSPTPSTSPSNNPEEFYFFQISDIHTNTTYESAKDPIGQYGEDGGLSLLDTVLENMQALSGDPAFILISGDFPTHSLPSMEDQINTISNVSVTIKNAFPNTPIYPALGNNDVYPDYYFPLNTTTQWMNDLSSLWGDQLGWISAEQLETFNPYGYYAVDELWENGPRLIVLNTVLYSKYLNVGTDPPELPTPPGQLPDDPNGQFEWLTAQLNKTRDENRRAIIQYHIPSGINSYDDSITWHEKFTVSFEQICSSYADVMIIHLAAHYHTDGARIISNTTGVLLNPSISPVHTNNPGFRKYVATTSSDEILNYYQYYTDLTAANVNAINGKEISFQLEYGFTSSYEISPINADGINKLLNQIVENLGYYMNYITYQYVFYPFQRGVTLCAIEYQDHADYMACIAQYDDDEN